MRMIIIPHFQKKGNTKKPQKKKKEGEVEDESDGDYEDDDSEDEESSENVDIENNLQTPCNPFGTKSIVSVNSIPKIQNDEYTPNNLNELLSCLAKEICRVNGDVIHSHLWMKIFSMIPQCYLKTPPTILSSSDAYYLQYRTDLATTIRPSFDVDSKYLTLETTSDPFNPSEIQPTQAWKDDKISMPRDSAIKGIIPVLLPDDCLISEVERMDYDTEFGRMFELIIPRIRNKRFSLDPPANHIKQQDKASTTVPLHEPKSNSKKTKLK